MKPTGVQNIISVADGVTCSDQCTLIARPTFTLYGFSTIFSYHHDISFSKNALYLLHESLQLSF